METAHTNSATLSEIAGELSRVRDGILAEWRTRIAASGDESLIETLSREEFYDGIPRFLERLCAALRGDSHIETMPSARQHGAHRWQQGLSFEEVMLEWRVLHRILFERVTTLWQTASLDLASLQDAYWLLAETVQHAVGASLAEFHQHQRLAADVRRRDLEAVLEQRDDLDQRRGEGLRQASHDLRGSLQVARFYCSALRHRDNDRQTGDIVERLSQAVDGLSEIFNDLLDLARLEAGHDECHTSEFDAALLLRELCDTMRPHAEARGLSLRFDGADTLPVRSDAVKLRRIAQNLLLNALAYTPVGSVKIGWQTESPTHWSFYVEDDGPGMPDSTAEPLATGLENAADSGEPAEEKAGQSGASDQSPSHGEGIGLAIVHRLCVLLNAVLDVDSESGRGTTFRVRLPF